MIIINDISALLTKKKTRNKHIGGKSPDKFMIIMDNLNLTYPRKIDFAVPDNQLCGQCPENIPEKYQGPCAKYDQGE